MILKLLFDRDRINLYPWYFAEQCLTKEIENVFGKKIPRIITEFKKSHIYLYAQAEDFNVCGEFLFNKLRIDRNFYKLVKKNILKYGEVLLDFCQKLPKNIEKLSDEELSQIYEEYREKTITMRAWGWLPPLVDGSYIYFLSDYLQEKLRAFLKPIGQEEKTAEYYSVLSSSEEMSEVQMEEVERLKLIQKLQKDPGLIKQLNETEASALLSFSISCQAFLEVSSTVLL